MWARNWPSANCPRVANQHARTLYGTFESVTGQPACKKTKHIFGHSVFIIIFYFIFNLSHTLYQTCFEGRHILVEILRSHHLRARLRLSVIQHLTAALSVCSLHLPSRHLLLMRSGALPGLKERLLAVDRWQASFILPEMRH